MNDQVQRITQVITPQTIQSEQSTGIVKAQDQDKKKNFLKLTTRKD